MRPTTTGDGWKRVNLSQNVVINRKWCFSIEYLRKHMKKCYTDDRVIVKCSSWMRSAWFVGRHLDQDARHDIPKTKQRSALQPTFQVGGVYKRYFCTVSQPGKGCACGEPGFGGLNGRKGRNGHNTVCSCEYNAFYKTRGSNAWQAGVLALKYYFVMDSVDCKYCT